MTARVLTIGEGIGTLRTQGIGTLALERELTVGTGGAEGNVAIGLARLGVPVTWLGRVGDDGLGARVVRELRAEGVSVIAPVDPDGPTGLMLKETPSAGRSVVTYYRTGSAGSRLSPDDLDGVDFDAFALLHVTGITPALSASARACIDLAIERAREAGVAVSFDVNHRSRLWSAEAAVETYREIARRSDILFAGADEAALLTGLPEDDAPALADGDRRTRPRRGRHQARRPRGPRPARRPDDLARGDPGRRRRHRRRGRCIRRRIPRGAAARRVGRGPARAGCPHRGGGMRAPRRLGGVPDPARPRSERRVGPRQPLISTSEMISRARAARRCAAGCPCTPSRSSAGSCTSGRVLVGERTQEPPDRADADRGVLRVRRRPRPAVVLRPRHPHTRGVPVEDDAPDARRELADEPGDGVGLVRLAVHRRGERVGHGIERAHDLRVVAVARDDDERAERLLGDLGRDRCRSRLEHGRSRRESVDPVGAAGADRDRSGRDEAVADLVERARDALVEQHGCRGIRRPFRDARDDRVTVGAVGHEGDAGLGAELPAAERERAEQAVGDLGTASLGGAARDDQRVEARELPVERDRLGTGVDDVEQRLPAAERPGEADGAHERMRDEHPAGLGAVDDADEAVGRAVLGRRSGDAPRGTALTSRGATSAP